MQIFPASPPLNYRSSGYVPFASNIYAKHFRRADGVLRSLQAPHAGSFRMVKDGPRALLLDFIGRNDAISINDITPAIEECVLTDGRPL